MNLDVIIGMILGALIVVGLALIGAAMGRAASAVHARKESRRPAPPREIDPKNPPKYALYVRDIGDPEEVCTCHGRPLKDNETILVWPTPPERLCEESYKDGALL